MWQHKKGSVIRGSQKMPPELLVMLFFVDDQLNSKHPERSWAFSLQQSWGHVSEDIFSFNIFLVLCHYIKEHFTKSNYTEARWAEPRLPPCAHMLLIPNQPQQPFLVPQTDQATLYCLDLLSPGVHLVHPAPPFGLCKNTMSSEADHSLNKLQRRYGHSLYHSLMHFSLDDLSESVMLYFYPFDLARVPR